MSAIATTRPDQGEQFELPLDPPSTRGRCTWLLELEWARRVVATVTPKEVCYALNLKASTLSEALDEKPGDDLKGRKALKGEWIAVLREMATDEQRAEYLRIIATPLHFVISRPVKTPTEELRELRAHLKREAPGVLRDFEKNR
jgi:hypothetical protein